MKKILLTAGIGVLLITSCKEKPPYINLSTTPVAPKVDTTYVLTTVPVAEPHNILIENFTGATCSNCPAAHDVLHGIDSVYAGRINIVSLYIKNFSQTTPPEGFHTDFRTQGATDIMNSVFPVVSGMPCAGIDRLPLGDAGTYGNINLIGRDQWNSIVASHIGSGDSVNLTLTSTFETGTRMATINLKITYVEEISIPQKFSIVVVEDSFVDVQEFPTHFDTAYHFNDIYRGSVTSGAFGETVLSSIPVKTKGRVYDVTYNYHVDTAWNPAHCRLVAYVTRGAATGGGYVYQSKQSKLKP